MPTFRRVPRRPQIADLRSAPGNAESNDAAVQIEPAASEEESYRDLQARAREAGVSPLNVPREELLAALGEGD